MFGSILVCQPVSNIDLVLDGISNNEHGSSAGSSHASHARTQLTHDRRLRFSAYKMVSACHQGLTDSQCRQLLVENRRQGCNHERRQEGEEESV